MDQQEIQLLGGPRVRVVNDKPVYTEGELGVYWMQRAQRIIDNPALNAAIKLCNAYKRPLIIIFCIDASYPQANLRHFHFMLQGLDEVASTSKEQHIPFLLLEGGIDVEVTRIVDQLKPAFMITDEDALRYGRQLRASVAKDAKCPVIAIDADVVVPSSLFTKEEYAARTFRPKLHQQLPRYLVHVGTEQTHYQGMLDDKLWKRHTHRPSQILSKLQGLNRQIQPVAQWIGGSEAGWQRVHSFIEDKLDHYSELRNKPELDYTSGVSPYLHFGQIGVGQLAYEIYQNPMSIKGQEAFLEELIVRRELAINYVWHNPNYDSLLGCHAWAQQSLRKHSLDPRPVVYSLEQLTHAQSHDPLWNAAQMQLVNDGWMHGYMRMYWAKKILEWSSSPEEAFFNGLYLNDTYSIDGRDCNGYTGLAWAIGGKHDRAWGPERGIFGLIRYMSYESTRRKFKSQEYIKKYTPE